MMKIAAKSQGLLSSPEDITVKESEGRDTWVDCEIKDETKILSEVSIVAS